MKVQHLLLIFGILFSPLLQFEDAIVHAQQSRGNSTSLAPKFFFPIEIGQGAVFTDATWPYNAALRAHFLYGLDSDSRLRLGPSGTVQYFSPDLEVLAGGRISYALFKGIEIGERRATIHLAIEGLFGTNNKKTLSGAVIADAFEVFLLTLRVGQELETSSTFFEVSFGADILEWLSEPDTADVDLGNPFSDLSGFYRIVAVRMSIESSWLLGGEEETLLNLSREFVGTAESERNTTSLYIFLEQNGLSKIVQDMRSSVESSIQWSENQEKPIPDLSDPANQQELCKALVTGWCVAMTEN